MVKKTLTNLILLSLEKSIDGYLRLEDLTYHHYRYRYGIPDLKKASFAVALKRLREGGFIELIDNGELTFRLTDQGKDRAVILSMQDDLINWDGKWRLVIFDIPEKRKVARELFRSKLKSWGFQKLQQSVWVTKKDCVKPLKLFIKQVGIQDWIKVFEARNIDLF